MHDDSSDVRAQKRPLVTAPFQKLKKAAGEDGALERRQKMQCQSAQKPKKTLSLKNFHAKLRDIWQKYELT